MKRSCLILLIVFISNGCSRNMWLYLGSGLDNEKVTIIKKSKGNETYIIRDSILINNDVIGITFNKKIFFPQYFGNVIEIKVHDSIYKYNVSCGKSLYCDFNLMNDTIDFSCRKLRKNEKFY